MPYYLFKQVNRIFIHVISNAKGGIWHCQMSKCQRDSNTVNSLKIQKWYIKLNRITINAMKICNRISLSTVPPRNFSSPSANANAFVCATSTALLLLLCFYYSAVHVHFPSVLSFYPNTRSLLHLAIVIL